MFGFTRICGPRWQHFWLLFDIVALLLTLTWCYDPCPEHLRSAVGKRLRTIPRSEIEKAFQEAEKIVQNKTEQEKRLVGEGKVVNRKIKSPESTHQQAFVKPEVRVKELRQRSFQEASSILTKKYRLTPEEVCCSLPEAELSSPSAARAVQNCINPETVQCDSSSTYRTADGTCNNLNNPTWGSAFSCFNRLLPAAYSDNETFRRSVTGELLPCPRMLSLNINSHQDRPTHDVNHLYMFFGQLLDHDLTLTAPSTTDNNEAIQCCPDSPDNHPQCAPIPIPSDDPFYSRFGVPCLNFVRSAICDYCATGPRAQINQVTTFIDASFVYGNSENETNALRDTDILGNLRVQRSAVGDLLPPSNDPQNDQCSIPDQNQICFQTGDVRGNQHPVLTSLHTAFMREHNRIASQLRSINGQWNEERIFQEAKKIVGAVMQAITYKEYLPITLGDEGMDSYDLWISSGTLTTSYNSSVDPTLYTEFSTAAFRFGHSMINSLVAEIPDTEGHNGHLLRDVFFYPFDLYTGEIDPVMRGSTRSPSQCFDRHVVPDVSNFLYRIRGNDTGLDLPAFNIQRGRDHGLEPYVEAVRYCSEGRIIIRSFDDLYQLTPSQNVDELRRNYEDVRDIDMFVGILSERPKDGAVIGPTAICLNGIQFKKLKYGDRYYFEHDGIFTADQRYELKKASLARILCDNTGIQEIQGNAMLFDRNNSPIRSCSYLPQVDLNAWRE